MMVVFGIPNCDTVKKARAWLSSQGVAHEFHDFKKHGLDSQLLAQWAQSNPVAQSDQRDPRDLLDLLDPQVQLDPQAQLDPQQKA